MILFHGSNMEVSGIDLSKCTKHKDFGQGFYMTSIKEQACGWARKVTRRFSSGVPTLSVYEFDRNAGTFLMGILPLSEISKALIHKKLNDQYSFHTPRALSFLKFLRSETP